MIAQQDVEPELEFAREKLKTAVPKRLHELQETVEGSWSRLEEWHASLMVKLLHGVSKACDELLGTTERDSLTAAAWSARNLLELWIWTEHCAASPEKARRFRDDALRDFKGLADAYSGICAATGNVNEFEADLKQSMMEAARKHFGTESVDSSYFKVSEAARGLGLQDWFATNYKFLSKVAHPTAGLIVGILHQSESLRPFQANCTTLGLYFAGRCVMAMERMVSSACSAVA